VALPVDGDGEVRRMPRGERAQARVQVDQVAVDQLGLVREPVRVGVEPAARDPEEAVAGR
jgi:hypothetical protein